ncbi:hypothetical protein [Microbispora sp. NPDC049633]|uniref:hypothetical protein n=1 Tax=Microbispora sp. NPDC049633 TaxID=3154355 RepID=UPI00341CDC2E
MTSPVPPSLPTTPDAAEAWTGGSGDDRNSNKPFHPWIQGYDVWWGGRNPDGSVGSDVVTHPIERGFIRTDTSQTDYEDNATPDRKLYFLYNPATLDMGFSPDGADFGATYVYTRKNGGQASMIAELNQSMSFQLLFDRTYEVSYPNVSNWTNPQIAEEGVWRDIRALLAWAGILDDTKGDVYQMTLAGFSTATMVQYPSYFHFGATDKALTVYGICTGISISWTHWSKSMVPIRAGVSIDVQLLPKVDFEHSPGSGNASSNSDASSAVGGSGKGTSGSGAGGSKPVIVDPTPQVPIGNGGSTPTPAPGPSPDPGTPLRRLSNIWGNG